MNQQTKICYAFASLCYIYNEPLNWMRFPRFTINQTNYEIMIEPDIPVTNQCKQSLDLLNKKDASSGQDDTYNTLFKFINANLSDNLYAELVIKNTVGCQCCIFRDITKNEIYVAFRGSDMPNDFATNLIFSVVTLKVDGLLDNPDVSVHSGFLKNITYNNIHLQIINTINSITHLYNMKKTKIYVIGHSLGGSDALLFSLILRAYREKMKTDWKIHIYTYACPVTGDVRFTNYVNRLLHKDFTYTRIITERDIVPRLSSSIFNYSYTHPGKKTIVIYENKKMRVRKTNNIQFETITMTDLKNVLYYHSEIYQNALIV